MAAWGLRLAVHIAWRGRGRGEDRRYAAMRQARGPSFWWFSLFKVFLLQATLAAALSAPLVVVQLRPAVAPGWCLAGLALWVAGFACEATADAQLLAFQGDPERRGQVLASGLWRYSRHPNYFGEALLWWGYGAFAAGSAGGFWTLYAPVVMTVLLLRVSGVPPLQPLPTATPWCVTLNRTQLVDPARVRQRMSFAHPQFDAAAIAAQQRWEVVSGRRGTHYCGAYWRHGFHEDGLWSGRRAAAAVLLAAARAA